MSTDETNAVGEAQEPSNPSTENTNEATEVATAPTNQPVEESAAPAPADESREEGRTTHFDGRLRPTARSV
jgi:hypothetical protein